MSMERLTYMDGGKWRMKIGDTEYRGKEVDRIYAAPIIFGNAGPYCKQHGYCPETKSCGNAPRLKDLLKGAAKNEQKATQSNEE